MRGGHLLRPLASQVAHAAHVRGCDVVLVKVLALALTLRCSRVIARIYKNSKVSSTGGA